jgi:hypothetical protein
MNMKQIRTSASKLWDSNASAIGLMMLLVTSVGSPAASKADDWRQFRGGSALSVNAQSQLPSDWTSRRRQLGGPR